MKYCVIEHCWEPPGIDATFCARHWGQVPQMLREDVLRAEQRKDWTLWGRAVVRARLAVKAAAPPGDAPVPTTRATA